MADKDFVVKNGLVVNSSFYTTGQNLHVNGNTFLFGIANSIILAGSQGIVFIGNNSVSSLINATSFSGTSYNSLNLNGQPQSYYTNASNITTGKLPYDQIPSNVVNTTSNFTISGLITFSANTINNANLEIRGNRLIVNTSSTIQANGGIGSAGQALLSNGSTVYWGTVIAGLNNYVQFNDSGVANGVSGLAFNKNLNGGTLTVGGGTTINATYVSATSYNSERLNGQSSSYYYPYSNPYGYANTTNGNNINGTSYNITQFTINQSLGTGNSPSFQSLYTVNQLNATGNQNTGMATGTGGLGGIMVQGPGGGGTAAFMSFHRPSQFAAYFGLDLDNQWKVGGWSYGDVAYNLLHSGNFNNWAPGLTGANASGTWGINITGNAMYLGGRYASEFVYNGQDSRTLYNLYTNVIRDTDDLSYYLDMNGNSHLNTLNLYGNELRIFGGSPTMFFSDTDQQSAILHCNSNYFYFLRADSAYVGWTTVGSGNWPMSVNLTNNNVIWGGDVAATYNVIAYASDKRLKENIVEIPNAIDKIKKIRGVTFDWNDKADELGFKPITKYNDLGVIAQEIQAVLPQAVAQAPFDKWQPDPDTKYSDEYLNEKMDTSRSGENYLTVQLEKIVPLLIEGIKEQQKYIEALEDRISKLESK
jgi:hypothetical protein